jgi:chromosomal replication initiator protein
MQPENMAAVSTPATPEELILRNFAATIGRKRYEHWFQNKTQVWVEGNELFVAVSTPFLVNWMSQHFRAGILAAAHPILGESADVQFVAQSDVTSRRCGSIAPTSSAESTLSERVVRLDSQSTADNSSDHASLIQTPHCVAQSEPAPQHFETRKSESTRSKTRTDKMQSEAAESNSRKALRDLCDKSAASVQSTNAAISASMSLDSASAVIVARATGPSTTGHGAPVARSTSPDLASQSRTRQSSTSTKNASTNSVAQGKPSASRYNGTIQNAARPVASKPESVERPYQPEKIEAHKAATERTVEKPVPSVSRVTKDSPLTLAKVKAVDEPPRSGRRFADLMDLVEGSCNEFALSAARQVCQAPGVQFTTLFVHGPVGVGKTHMLEGIHRDLKLRFPSRQVVYLTAEAFANFFTQALRDHKLPSFRQKFRSIDILIVDDIDFLDGKRGIQEEFLFTIQQLESHGRMVVVGAHGHPRLLTKMSEELRTRFLAGMVCRIDPPDVMTRRRIIENKAFRAGADFAPEVFQFVADRFRNNVRELEGAFNTLLAYQRMQGRRLSLTAARNALSDLERDCIRVVRIVDVEQAVCTMFGVTVEELKSNKRQKSLSQPRMLAMYLARKHTRAAYTEIGQHFGGRNHSTVIAAEKKITASMTGQEAIVIRTQSWHVSDLIETLEQQLLAG